MEKEIQIMEFVIKEQNKRNIEKGLINSSQIDEFNHRVLTEVEMQNRNRVSFNEIKEVSHKKNTCNFKGYLKLAVLVGMTFVLVKTVKYENQPIRVVVNELTSDSGLNLTDDGRTISGKMTQEELANYAISNGLTIEQIEVELEKYSKKQNLNYEFVEKEVEKDNEELFKRL